MQVPFLDLGPQTKELSEELNSAIEQVISSGAFIGGPMVEAFEGEFAAFCGSSYAAGVSSGTAALELSLRALNIGPGDEVITAANTFIATAEAISLCGATPVFVDIDPQTSTLDPDRIGAAVSARTRAIIPVHLYGQMANMDPIMAIAAANDLFVIEDACQAHGARYKGRAAGTIGDFGCFSFYPGKNLGAFGDAGAVVTSDEELYLKIRALRDHGQIKKYAHIYPGTNARLDAIQAAVLRTKLPYLENWNEKRRQVAAWYREALGETEDIHLPQETDQRYHVYHIYAIQISRRETLMAYLKEKGIGCGIHYPIPIHLQRAYRHLGLGKGSYPRSESACQRLLSLPMYPDLRPNQTSYVSDTIKKYFIRAAHRR